MTGCFEMKDQFKIYPTKGIEIEHIDVGDMVEFTCPSTHGRHFNKVIKIKKGRITVIDVVKEKTILGIKHIRMIYKDIDGKWVKQPIPDQK